MKKEPAWIKSIKFKRGKIKIDRRLDLHGYSVLSARQTFKEEVLKLFDRNKRICEIRIFNGGHEIPQEIYGDIIFFIRRCFIDNS